MNLFLWNVRSLGNNLKIHFILQTLKDCNIDIAFITESWLTEGFAHTASLLNSFKYELSHTFRPNRIGGGVAVLIRKPLDFTVVHFPLTVDSFEWHAIRLPSMSYLFVTIYRKQEIPLAVFLREFEELLSGITNKYLDTVFVTGDFNVHFQVDNKPTTDLRDALLHHGLVQHVEESTNIYGNTIDLIFSNPCEVFLKPTVESSRAQSNNPNIKFDHYPIFFSIPSSHSSNVPIKQYRSWRNIKHIDISHFQLSLADNLSSVDLDSDDFGVNIKAYNDCLSQTLDSFAPVQSKLMNINEEQPPEWLDSDYRDARRLRRKLEKQWKRLGTAAAHNNFVDQRDLCVVLANNKIRQFYRNILDSAKDQSTLFKTVSKLWNKGKCNKLPTVTDDEVSLANDFNQFFSSKVENIRESFHADSSSVLHGISESEENLTESLGSELHTLQPSTIDELREILSSMTLKTSFDDPLPASLYKSSLEILLPYILDLVNLSLLSGDMSGLKESTISPILKKLSLDSEVKVNFRPIFNLQFLSKLIEKVVLKRLTDHMDRNNLKCNNQFGYKKGHSTESMVLQIVDETLIGFERKTATVLVLLDMSAAFDTVDLQKLMIILERKIGIRGVALQWFQSFLFGRQQKVKIHGFTSELLATLYGVPQGSVLGPVLFNIYVSSLSEVMNSTGVFSSSYADDTNARIQLSLQFQLHNISQRIPKLIGEVQLWMNQHFLKLNPQKTEIILLYPPQDKHTAKLNGVFIDNECLRFSETVELLGVKLDQNLSFDAQVNETVTTTLYHLKNISKIKRYLTTSEVETVIHAFLTNKLDYCNSILFGVNQATLSKLQSVQNKAARIVLGLSHCAHVTDEMLTDLHWLKVHQRIIFKVLLFVHKFFLNTAPHWFSQQLIIVNIDERLLHNMYFNSKSGRRSFSYAAPRFWNCLKKEIRLLDDTERFKTSIKTVLFKNTNNIIGAVQGYAE